MSGLESTGRVLSLARDLLRQSITPALPADLRYPAAMVAAAMAIAARELALGQAARAKELEALSSLYPKAKSDLHMLRWQLCRDLRDQPTTFMNCPQLRAALKTIVKQRLAISHPEHQARC